MSSAVGGTGHRFGTVIGQEEKNTFIFNTSYNNE
jgi:hypothetical protein